MYIKRNIHCHSYTKSMAGFLNFDLTQDQYKKLKTSQKERRKACTAPIISIRIIYLLRSDLIYYTAEHDG